MTGAGWWVDCGDQHYSITDCLLSYHGPGLSGHICRWQPYHEPPPARPWSHLPPLVGNMPQISSDNGQCLVSRLSRRPIVSPASVHNPLLKSWKLCPLAAAGGRSIAGLEPTGTYFPTKSCRFCHISPSLGTWGYVTALSHVLVTSWHQCSVRARHVWHLSSDGQ